MATAPIAATGLIAGYGVAVASGSRPLGGAVLACCGLICAAIWTRRDGRRTALLLAGAGLVAFGLSHLLGVVIGAWPAVLVVSAAIALIYWTVSDVRYLRQIARESAPDRLRAAEATTGNPR